MITYPLNNINYTAEDAELYLSGRISGIFSLFDFPIVSVNQPLSVSLGVGKAWINNTQFSGKVAAEPKNHTTLTFDYADPVQNRIDVIAIEFNREKNETCIVIIKGDPSENPKTPEIIQTEDIFQLFLYSVYRHAGQSELSETDITDLREHDEYCGFVSDHVASVISEQNNGSKFKIWVGTQEEYNSIVRDNLTFYIITDDDTDKIIDYVRDYVENNKPIHAKTNREQDPAYVKGYGLYSIMARSGYGRSINYLFSIDKPTPSQIGSIYEIRTPDYDTGVDTGIKGNLFAEILYKSIEECEVSFAGEEFFVISATKILSY